MCGGVQWKGGLARANQSDTQSSQILFSHKEWINEYMHEKKARKRVISTNRLTEVRRCQQPRMPEERLHSWALVPDDRPQ